MQHLFEYVNQPEPKHSGRSVGVEVFAGGAAGVPSLICTEVLIGLFYSPSPKILALLLPRHPLQDYRQRLQRAYQGQLRLRVYAVVAVGVERLVWEAV